MRRLWPGRRSGAPGEGEAEPWDSHGVRIETRPARRSVARRVIRAVLLLLVGYYVLCVVLLLAYRFVAPPTTGVQVQRRVEALAAGREYSKQREFVRLEDLPRHVPRAVAAAEDGRFWDHRGFDWTEMRKAAGEEGRLRGASTITQQLMKNLFGSTHRNPIRKVYDLTLTPVAEVILGKSRIMELYLNEVEWGPGVYGIEAAAEHHYGKDASDLSRTQAAGLAALLPGPLRRTPGNTSEYRASILSRMGSRGW